MKKIIALALALIMALSMASVAFAAATEVTDEAGLATAIAAGGDIILGDNITVNATLTIPADKTVIIDLNGHKISYSADVKLFEVKGNLTVKNGTIDSTGTGTVFYGNNGEDINNGVSDAELTLENLTVTTNGYITGGNGNFPHWNAITITGGNYNTTNGGIVIDLAYNGVATLTNVKATSTSTKSLCEIGSYHSATATLTNCEFTAAGIGNMGYTVGASYGAQVTINGGTYVGADIVAQAHETTWNGGPKATLTINGGSFTGKLENNPAGVGEGNLVVSGGSFTEDVTEFLAPGAQQGEDGNIYTDAVPGETIIVSTDYARADYKVKSYDFTTGTKGYKGASYIDEIKINKNNQLVIVLKDNYKLATDKLVKGEIVLQKKADKTTVTIPVFYTVANKVVEISGSRKADEATVITPAENAMYVMDEEGGYVTFTEEALTGTVKMNKEEKAFLNIWYGYIEEVTEDSIDAFEAFVGEDYIDEAIIEYYTFETRAFKNEVSFAFDAWEDDPHYFYLWDGEKLSAIDAKYDDDEDVEAYVWTGLAEGTIIVTDVEIVLAAEETSKNPNTGASDVVGMASALAVVSLIAVGAISLKK